MKRRPVRMLFLIARQFNQLLQMKELKNQGYDQNSIASRMKIQPFIVKNSWRQMESLPPTKNWNGPCRGEVRRSRRSRQNRPHERPDERGDACDCDVYDVDIRPIQCYYGKQKLTELFGKDVRENEAVSGCDHDQGRWTSIFLESGSILRFMNGLEHI